MQCPSCSSTLETIDYEGIKIETCPGCEGQWLDASELRHIVNVRERRFDEDQRRAVATAASIDPVQVDHEDRDLRCPKCGGQTDVLNYGGDSGIMIDKCTGCGGIWLDAGELERIQIVVEGWQDGLPETLRKHGPRLRQVSAEVEQRSKVRVSRLGFVNAIINGVVNVFE